MNVTIIANGELPNASIPWSQTDLLIAADGGASHCLQLGVKPEVVIGDFDSLTRDELEELEKSGVMLMRYPAEKNETDLELALDYAIEQGAQKITLVGLLGGRWDMSFANILLLGSPKYAIIQFNVIASNTELFILHGGQSLALTGKPGDLVSVIPLSQDVSGLTYQGLAWTLENASLPFGTPRGISNSMLEETAQIYLKTGLLLVVIEHSERK